METETEDSLRKKKIEILQANIGLYCNQACNHCHVESSPKRKEMMLQQTAERCLLILQNSPSIHTLDLTGKAKTVTVNHAYSEHKGTVNTFTTNYSSQLLQFHKPNLKNV